MKVVKEQREISSEYLNARSQKTTLSSFQMNLRWVSVCHAHCEIINNDAHLAGYPLLEIYRRRKTKRGKPNIKSLCQNIMSKT